MITTIPADLQLLFIVGMIFGLGTLRQIQATHTILANKYFGAAARRLGLVSEYARLGDDLESVAPAARKKPTLRFSGRRLNFLAIILEPVKRPRHG